jgi:hypothetical protein
MKFTSKLVLLVAMGATALTALTGMASAQETYAVTKYEASRTGGVDTQALTFGLSGKYKSGFAYDIELMSADTRGASTIGADVGLSYRIGGIAGPVALYEAREFGGAHSDQFLVGVEGGTEMFGADLFGKALFDTDDKDQYRLSIGAGYALSNDLSLSGELTHFQNVGLPDANKLEIGARYKVVGNLHADVGAHYNRAQGGAETKGLHLGLGFSF